METNGTPAAGRRSRALRILNCLQAGPAFNAKELARRLNVSRRTIFRDLNLIRSAGVQVFFDEQHDGYRLSYNTACLETPQFDDQELADFILLAHLSWLRRLPGYSQNSRELAAKLLCSYPYAVRTSIARLLNACVFRHPAGRRVPERSSKMLRLFFEAIRRQKQLRVTLDCRDTDRATRTKFAPYRIELSLDRWSVTGRSSAHRGHARLEMEEVHHAELTGDSYDIPRGYRLKEADDRGNGR